MEYLVGASELVRQCPLCRSVYITERECEDCGYQFRNSNPGDTLDDKSFYSLKESFLRDQSFFEKFFYPEQGERYVDFRKSLLIRLKVLLRATETPWDDPKKWNYFQFELMDLIKFLSKSPRTKKTLDDILTNLNHHPFYHEIKKSVVVKEDKINISIKPLFLIFLLAAVLIIAAPFIYKQTKF